MASTSATPGHTKKFHFFAVNADRKDIASFYLVDVPGLGYAEAEDGVLDSWKNLIERYLAVRTTLKVVFHLVDARLPDLSETDKTAISLVSKALSARQDSSAEPFLYTVVLTKVDKSNEKDIAAVKRAVRAAIAASPLGVKDERDEQKKSYSNVKIITSSSVTREGRDSIWSLLGDEIYL